MCGVREQFLHFEGGGVKTFAIAFCVALSGLGMALCAGCERHPPRPSDSTPSTSSRLTIEYEVLPSILIEAEWGEVHEPMAVFEDEAASGGKYVLAPEGPNHEEISIGGDVTCRIQLAESAGEYNLWLRANWSCDCGNSVSVALDGVDLGTVEDPVYQTWHWVRLRRSVQLSVGEHLLTLTNREDGAAVDQILLTQDLDYRPTDVEAADVKGRIVLKPPLTPEVAAPESATATPAETTSAMPKAE